MLEMLSSLDMERGVGGRVGEGEVAALENWESRNTLFRQGASLAYCTRGYLVKEEDGEAIAWRSSIELDGHAGAAARIIFPPRSRHRTSEIGCNDSTLKLF